MEFFTQIYKQHTGRVLAAMDESSGGDLTHFAINCIYGELLADHSIISARDTGLLEFVCCLADDCGPQAKGYVDTRKHLVFSSILPIGLPFTSTHLNSA